MKHFLGMLLGESVEVSYDAQKYASLPRQREVPGGIRVDDERSDARLTEPPRATTSESLLPARRAPDAVVRSPLLRDAAPAPSNQIVYGSSGGELQNHAQAQQEASSLGCWLVSQPGVAWPVRQELQADTLPLQARVQIAAASAAPLGNGSAAVYESDTFMSPLATSQPVIATGSLINTYTGEVVDLFEDAMPPPDNGRDAGDAERERRQAQRRLLAAEGNINASHRKREQQHPIQAGDAGAITQAAHFQVNADVATEWNERANRDVYFNRNELAPTELEMTRNPFGFEGYNNRIRIAPYLLPTQDLDDKQWAPNATLLPGGDHRPKDLKPRLKKDRPRTDYAGQVSPQVPINAMPDNIRRSVVARDQEGKTLLSRGADASQALYGDAAKVESIVSQVPRAVRGQKVDAAPSRGLQSSIGNAFSTVTASSVLASIGLRGINGQAPQVGLSSSLLESSAALSSTEARASHRKETLQEAPPMISPSLLAHDLAQAQGQDFNETDTLAALAAAPLRNAEIDQRVGLAATQRQQLGEKEALLLRESLMGVSSLGVSAPDGVALQTQGLSPENSLNADLVASTLQSNIVGSRVESTQISQNRSAEMQEFRPSTHDPERGLEAATTVGVLVGRDSKKRALEHREGYRQFQERANAAGAHGAFGEVDLQTRASTYSLEERPSAAHREHGFSERNSRVTTSNARGDKFTSRMDILKVGGHTDFQKKAELAAREGKHELQTAPYVASSAGGEGQRSLLGGGREIRRPRLAKSPIKAHRLRERSGLSASLQEPLESRFED